MSTAVRPRNPIRFGDAWRALQKLMADPDRTDQVFVIIDSLAGNSGERQFRRFASTPVGQRVLAEVRAELGLQDLPPVYVGLRSNEGRQALESTVP